MEAFGLPCNLIILVFILGYLAIVLEYYLKINKSAAALLLGVLCWSIYLICSTEPLSVSLDHFGDHVSNVSQIIFFLMGAMTLVELIDTHHGFRIITDRIQTTSKRQLLWIIAFVAFFLSAILDNLTTTILMVSLLRKIITHKEDRFLFVCIVVAAANAGGAWTPIGDVTTTMLWINGQLSTFGMIKVLFIPSLVSMLIPLAYFTYRIKGKFTKREVDHRNEEREPGANLVFCLGIGGLAFVPLFKAITGLPPFMGVILALAVLWFVTDFLHHKYETRAHLRVPHILTRIDTSGILFFLGILLAVNALETAGILDLLAHWLNDQVSSLPLIATFIGIISAIVDNVPLVAATMGMYPIQQFPTDSSLWMMIAYAAGTGGSIFIIGSAAGVAAMGMEKIDFISYMKKASLPILIGYLAGMGVYLLFS